MKHSFSDKSNLAIKVVSTTEEKDVAFDIRKKVFVDEQQVPLHLEMDEHDEHAIHFICYEEDVPVGASRLRFVQTYGKLERICILQPYRLKSYGQRLIHKMEKEIRSHGYRHATLNAQTVAQAFYERLGYEVVSEPFFDAGMPHVTMTKTL